MTEPQAPDHIDDTVQAIVQMQENHANRASPKDRLFAWLIARIVTAECIAGVCLLTVLWIGANLAAPRLGWPAFDPLPFDLLQGIATFAALAVTVLILAAQRHDDRIGTQREQLSLQLAMLNDRKLAKLIALVEELRRDSPAVRDRADPEADALSLPTDPHSVLDAIERG